MVLADAVDLVLAGHALEDDGDGDGVVQGPDDPLQLVQHCTHLPPFLAPPIPQLEPIPRSPWSLSCLELLISPSVRNLNLGNIFL